MLPGASNVYAQHMFLFIDPDIVLFFTKKYQYFSYFSTKIHYWYSLEMPRRGTSDEYPQHVFMEE